MMQSFIRKIDTVNELVGKITAWLLIPMTLITAYEVTMRYLLNRPTIWAWDINIQILGAMTFLLGGYVLLRGGHVCVDILPRALSQRKRNILELVLGVMFFLVFSLVLWQYAGMGLESVRTMEKYTSLWEPPLFPLRVIAFIGILLLFLQGIANFIRRLHELVSKTEDSAHDR